MEVIIRPTQDDCIAIAAKIVAQYVREREKPVLGLATGSTQISLYKALIAMHRDGKISFRHCLTFNLDEYVGLEPSHPQSYHYYMQKHFFDHVDIPTDSINIPPGMYPDLRQVCRDYEVRIKQVGGINLQLLGIGTNGHIGFNEPMGSLASRTWVKILSRKTIEDNSRFFQRPEAVPRHVISMGIGTILEAEHCLVLAFGEKKAQAVLEMIEGPVTARCPASALQLHQRTTVLLDEPAAAKLQYRSNYAWVEANKLDWQKYDIPENAP